MINKSWKNIFLDVGNTNIKYCLENSDIAILSATKKNIKKLFKKYKNTNFIVLNNNENFEKFFSKKKNIFKFDYHLYKDKLPKLCNFCEDEIGNDLWFIILFMLEHKSEDLITFSFGTYFVAIVKKLKKIVSINIGLGYSQINNYLKNKFNIADNIGLSNNAGTSTKKSLMLNNYLLLQSQINGLINRFNLKQPKIIICGNDFQNVKNDFKNYKLYLKFIYDPYLVLNYFRKWYFEKIKNDKKIF